MRKLIIAFAVLLAGCSSFSTTFENRLAFTANCDTLFFLSKYGPMAIGSTISDKDAQALPCVVTPKGAVTPAQVPASAPQITK